MKASVDTVLVTGGAGFIGSHIVDDFLNNQQYKKVVVLDNLILPVENKDKKINIRHNLSNPKLFFYEEDLQNKIQLYKIFKEHKPGIVVHVAAVADARNAVEEPQKYIDNNVTSSLNLFEASKDFGVERLIFFSSSSVYGNKNRAPFTEVMQADFPISPYGATKKAGEVLAHTYHHNFGMNIHIFRIFNAFGPRMRPNLVLYKWVKAILDGDKIEMSGKGTRKRDYTFVGDIVDAVNKSIVAMGKNTKTAQYEIMNIGNSNPIALKDLLKKLETVLGMKAKVMIRPSHNSSVEKTHADTKKAKKIIGWKPTTKFEDGVKEFVNWFQGSR